MEAAKACNYTPVVEEIESWDARINFHCSVCFEHYYLMFPHCHLGVVDLSQTGNLVEPYWLSPVEIHWST